MSILESGQTTLVGPQGLEILHKIQKLTITVEDPLELARPLLRNRFPGRMGGTWRFGIAEFSKFVGQKFLWHIPKIRSQDSTPSPRM